MPTGCTGDSCGGNPPPPSKNCDNDPSATGCPTGSTTGTGTSNSTTTSTSSTTTVQQADAQLAADQAAQAKLDQVIAATEAFIKEQQHLLAMEAEPCSGPVFRLGACASEEAGVGQMASACAGSAGWGCLLIGISTVIPIGEIADALGIIDLVASAGAKALDAVAPGLSDALANGLAGAQDLLSSLTSKASQLASKILGDDSELDALECGGNSFTAGILVLTASGALVPISALHTGEKVAAGDTSTGKKKVETVDSVLVHYDTDLYDLAVDTPEGKQDIQTTANHLIWDLTTHQWTQAAKLHNGDRLLAANDTTATAVGGTTPADTQGWMWDLTIDNLHDFYVVAGDTPVLVHNSDCPRVIGNNPDYQKAAASQGTQYFEVPMEQWSKLTPGQQWEANQKFLDRGVASGAEFRLATPIDFANPSSVYLREVNYLLGNGYTFNDAGDSLAPGG